MESLHYRIMVATGTLTPTERKALFRAYMHGFNPTENPSAAIEKGLVERSVEPGLAGQIADRADIDPGCAQAVLGGIGSGKTTQLLLAQQEVAANGGVALFAEVASFTDITTLSAGALTAILGAQVAARVAEDRPAEARELQQFAYGRWEIQESGDEYEEPEIFVRGKLQHRLAEVVRSLEAVRPALSSVREFLGDKKEIVFLVDGLDRLTEPDLFWSVVEADLAFLKSLGISVVVVAPWALSFTGAEKLASQFDRAHELKAENPENRATSMQAILTLRDTKSVLTSEASAAICAYSGGVLRDLITLARDAGEAAYLEDADSISEGHVEAAARGLGRIYELGLTAESRQRIRFLARGRPLQPTDPSDLALLLSRKAVQVSAGKYKAHPALNLILQ